MEFNDLYWHDSIIKAIIIDRKNPGIKDDIQLNIEWFDTGEGTIIFEDVYWANLRLNFGIVAQESIMNAYIANASDADLHRQNEIWQNVAGQLTCYVIELNATGSLIKIVAKGFTQR